MKGDKKLIQHLNTVLGNELIAINQYFLHSRMYKDWGLEKLAEKEYQESIEEMRHADVLVQRILFLEGVPNLQKLGQLLIGENVKEALNCDLQLEYIAKDNLQEAIVYAESIQDFTSREIFQNILTNEEEHIDWLETQMNLLEKMGEANYTQSNM